MSRPQEPKGRLCEGCPRFANQRCTPSGLVSSGPAQVLIVGDQPDDKSAAVNEPFNGHGGTIFKKVLKELKDFNKDFQQITHRITYAVQCNDPTDSPPSKEVSSKCSIYLQTLIAAMKPKVIVAMGAGAMRQLGFKMKHGDARGKMVVYGKEDTPVLVTFSEKALVANPGLYDTFKLDLKNAYARVNKPVDKKTSLEEIAANYLLPKTVDDAVAVCDLIVKYAQSGDPNVWAISVDTETTTLRPEKDSAKIIAFCFGWGKGQATTILFDHPHAPDEYKARLPEVKEAIQRVLSSGKPKILHNAKFDLKFIELKYNMPVQNVAWDTLLGEHLLDEDKKGNYGLKALTAGWLPQYCGYEDKLYDLLTAEEGVSEAEEMAKEIEDQAEALQKDHPEYFAALQEYQRQLVEYELWAKDHRKAQKFFEAALEDYLFKAAHYAGRLAAWQIDVADWPKGKRGKPPKPVRNFVKPVKLEKRKKPKRPPDPRSKKERQIAQDAGFENVPVNELQTYGAVDADVTRQLVLIQKQRIKNERSNVGNLMRTHAIPASRVLGRMEYFGTRVDLDYVEKLDEGLRKIVSKTEEQLYAMSPTTTGKDRPFKLNGSLAIADVLFNIGWTHPDGTKMAPYPVIATTKKNQASTSEKVLRSFVAYEDLDKQIPTKEAFYAERLITYRKAHKALNTFLSNIRVLSKRDGFLHTQFHLNGTGTGRLSSSDMNMQNIPKFLAGWNIKKLFIPDDDTFDIVNVDYKGAEVRVFTAYARDTALIQALNEGLDMHSFFAHKVFGRPYEHYEGRENTTLFPDKNFRKLLDTERSRIKRVVFGILYGAGPTKIAETIGIPLEEAQKLIDLLYTMFPAIKAYADYVETEVLSQGWVETHFARRRRFPLARIRRHQGRAVRQARNFKIQSTSSDIVIGQLVEIDEPLRRDLGGRMLLTVHDSLVLQTPKKYRGQLKEFLLYYGEKRVAQKYQWLPVPFKVDIELGANYGECMGIDKFLAAQTYVPQVEGIVEEHELLTELREDAFVSAA
jgi:uracil-DNA glycosylase family 4